MACFPLEEGQEALASHEPIRAIVLFSRALLDDLVTEWLRSKIGAEIVGRCRTVNAARPTIQDPETNANLLIADASVRDVFSAIAEASHAARGIRVVVITSAWGDYVSRRATQAGANAIVHETDGVDTFTVAVRTALSGGHFLSRTVVERRASYPVINNLTPKELEVFASACRGSTDEETASLLGISPTTAETHRRNVLRKLGTGDWMELVVLGLLLGVCSLEEIKIGSRQRRSALRRKTAR